MDTQDDLAPPAAARKKGLVIFREADASPLHDAGVMESSSSPVATAGMLRLREAGIDESYVLKCLFRSPGPDGFSLTYAWFKGNYMLPRHTHNSDCLYYVIAGSIRLGDEVLGDGDGFFIAAGTPYAYQVGEDGVEILEFRDSSRFDINIDDGTARSWDRLAAICEANRDNWKLQRPPIRRRS